MCILNREKTYIDEETNRMREIFEPVLILLLRPKYRSSPAHSSQSLARSSSASNIKIFTHFFHAKQSSFQYVRSIVHSALGHYSILIYASSGPSVPTNAGPTPSPFRVSIVMVGRMAAQYYQRNVAFGCWSDFRG